MRKFLIIFMIVIAFFLIYYLQVNIFSTYTIAGISPNLFIIFVLFVGLYANQVLGITFGVLIGLFLDSLYGNVIGISAVMYCFIGYLGSYFDKNFSKDNKLTILIMVIGATIIYELGAYFISSIILKFDREFWIFTKIIFVEVIYNVLLSIIIYPIIQKTGYLIDRNFKKNNILTRYF